MIHLFLPWRSTDYAWVRPPELPYSPDETLRRIGVGEFAEADSKLIAARFFAQLELDNRNPNKTAGARNASALFYNYMAGEHRVLGLVLAIATAHYANMDTVGKLSSMIDQGGRVVPTVPDFYL